MIELIHNPLGLEHPYEQGPEERVPRQPLTGESFTVGIVTRPPGAVKRVTVHTRLNDQPGAVIDAVKKGEWHPELEIGAGAEYLERLVRVEQDVWHAELTAPPVGDTLTYWIESGDQVTPAYTIHGRGWQTRFQSQPDQLQPGVMHLRPTGITGAGRAPQQVEWLTDGKRAHRVRLTFTCPPDEAFYGLGERFNALNQRGEIMDVRCYEQYKNQGKRTYMPIPFLLSSSGYALFVNSNRWMQFDLAATTPDRWTLEADLGPDESLELTWFVNDDPLESIAQFTQLTGPAALPPLWNFGLWMSANEWNSQARVMQVVEESFAHDIHPSVLVIEAWSDENTFYIWNDAQYTPTPGAGALRYADFTFPPDGKWPNPKAMIDSLHAQQIRLILWQIPAIKLPDAPHPQHEADRAYVEQAGLAVRNPDGSFYRIRPFWFRGGYLWDVTNSAAREWWFKKRAYLLEDLGVDGFKTDGGEHLWSSAAQFADGRTGEELWNVYPQLYTEAYYQFITEKRNGDALLFSRAGYIGSQRSPTHWAGDENSNWDAYRHSILAGLSAGISGIPFWGWDIGGFSGEIPSAELYLRSAALAAFCPIMQYHAEYNQHRTPCHDRTPWNIQERTGDDRVIPAFRLFVNIRHNLMPYIWQEAQHAAQTGEPMMRAVQLWDSQASPYQYFFGRDLLVCPVVEEGITTWPVYLPAGDWIDFWTHERFAGNQTIQVSVPLDRIPVYIRAGAAVPVVSTQLDEYVPLTSSPNDFLRTDA